MDHSPPHASETLLPDQDATVKAAPGDDVKIWTHGKAASDRSLFKTDRTYLVSPALKAWSFDLISCALSICSLAAIIITLAIHKGNTLPSWPLGITVNALISVFAVIFKVTLLVPVAGALSQLKWSWFQRERPLIDLVDFDYASRGNIWSSAVLIGKTKALKLPALGGLLMITAIAADPFIQQVVRYEPCPQLSPDLLATVSRTNNYTTSGIHTGAAQESLDAPMQAAIYKGVYDAWSHVSPTCVSGNCTFPAFRAVGVCSECEDITKEIRYTPVDANTSSEAWSLASGLWIGGASPYVLNMTSVSSQNSSILLSTEILSVSNETAYDEYRSLSTSTAHKKPIKPTVWTPNGTNFVVAGRCSLRPCVRTTQVRVNSSQLTETTLSSSEMKQATLEEEGYLWSWSANPMPCLINGSYFDASAFTESNVTNATNKWPVHGLLPNNQTAWLPDECVFVYGTTLGVGQFLYSFLQGFLAIAPETHYASPSFIEQLWHEDVAAEEAGEFGTVGSSFDLMNKTWSSLADSMSAHIRQSGDRVNSAPAVGQTLHMDTCLVVRWRWLSYPIVLLFLTIVLVMFTAAGSLRKTKTHQLWRDSPLALLFHGLDEQSRLRGRNVEQKREMEHISMGVYARIVDSGDGAEFQCVDRR